MVNKAKIYLSDVYKPELKVIETSSKSVLKTVKCNKTIEKMLLLDGKVFLLNWSAYGGYANNSLMVADTSTDLITNTVQLSKEPNSLVADKNGKLWILCSGGFLHEEKARLFCMNPADLSIVTEFEFYNQLASPSQLCINKTNDTLFFLDKHVFRMAITDGNLPQQPIVNGDNKLFYALGVSPDNSRIYVSDAIDYQQKGTVYVYNATGKELYSFKAGIIPGAFVFN
jgi:outer membrane protein assembly factor BamB